MATENWYSISGAIASVPYDQWSNSGGANKNASTRAGGGRAGPATHDDATTMITAGTGGFRQSLNVDWPEAFSQGSLWDGTTFHANLRLQVGNAGDRVQGAFTNAGGVGGTAWADSTGATSWTSVGPTDVAVGSTYKPGGGDWLTSDFANSTTIFSDALYVTAIASVNVTSLWGDIGFIQPAGGFVFLLQLAGLGALPFVGAMDFAHFRRYLSWRRANHRRHTILTGDEVRTAWDEIRAYRHPRYFMPGVAWA